MVAELSRSRPLPVLAGSSHPDSALAGLLGPGLEYGPRDDLLGMLAWAAGAAGEGLPWEDLGREEAAWLKWVLPPSVLLHRLHPNLVLAWRQLSRLSPRHQPDYAALQALLKDAIHHSHFVHLYQLVDRSRVDETLPEPCC